MSGRAQSTIKLCWGVECGPKEEACLPTGPDRDLPPARYGQVLLFRITRTSRWTHEPWQGEASLEHQKKKKKSQDLMDEAVLIGWHATIKKKKWHWQSNQNMFSPETIKNGDTSTLILLYSHCIARIYIFLFERSSRWRCNTVNYPSQVKIGLLILNGGIQLRHRPRNRTSCDASNVTLFLLEHLNGIIDIPSNSAVNGCV